MAKARKIKGIDCEGSAKSGIKLVLIERFNEMCALRHDALNWKDIEGVHSMRVASRRLRSAIRDFTPFVNKRGLSSTLKQIKNIADALGEVRDQDVAILELVKLSEQTPPNVSVALKDLIKTRKDVRRSARRNLKKILVKDELKELRSDFEAAIGSATTPRNPTPQPGRKAEISYVRMARAVIRERHKELEKLSNNLYKPFEVEPLHEMRIAAKRLRYAIELFQQCFEPGIASIAKSASHLQTALGTVHDCDIWIDSFGKEIIKAKKMKLHDQSEAFSWLMSHFIEVRDGHLQAAFSHWNQWEVENFGNKLREALKPPTREILPRQE
jgi:CHAD domain-containing protein